MTTVRVKNGSFRNIPVVDETFHLVKEFHEGKKGKYVTVLNDGHFSVDCKNIKIKLDDISDIEVLDGSVEDSAEPAVVETDEEAMNRIAERFAILDEMSTACINGDIRAMIVTGPPGVGKSHSIIERLQKAALFTKLASKRPQYEVVKGAISGIGLFALLYKYSDAKNTIIFDDCDVWSDPDALNVLKGALDSGKSRRIAWHKDSRKLREEGIPNAFDFNGTVIFITNIDVAGVKRNSIKDHVDALQSRTHYLDLTINTTRDKLLRIKQVHRDTDGGLFADYGFSDAKSDMIISYMEENSNDLREISLRMAKKIADLVKISPKNWKTLAKATVCKNKRG